MARPRPPSAANNHRYERLGFEQVGEFFAPRRESGLPVTTMWREPR